MKIMTHIIKKPDPIILNDYAEVGSAYSRMKVKYPYSIWKNYEDFKKEFIRLHTLIGKQMREQGYCEDWLWDDYKEARENLMLAQQMIDEEIMGKPVVVKEGERHKFKGDGSVTILNDAQA